MAALLRRNYFLLKRKRTFYSLRADTIHKWSYVVGRKLARRIATVSLGILTGVGATCGAFLYFLDRSVNAYELTPDIPSYPWVFQGYLKSLDHSAVRRGWQVYRTVCYTCHSIRYVRFMDLINVSHTKKEAKSIAEEFEIEDGPDEEGNYYTRPGKLSDLIPTPYSNEEAAKHANFGAAPPDLTYIVEARKNGRNYLFSFLTGWMDPPAGIHLTDTQYFNAYFPGNIIGMPQMLVEGSVEYDDGTPATTSQMAKDLTEFFNWTAAQEFNERKLMFIKAMGICFVLYITSLQLLRTHGSTYRSRQIIYVPKKK